VAKELSVEAVAAAEVAVAAVAAKAVAARAVKTFPSMVSDTPTKTFESCVRRSTVSDSAAVGG
jgi:hypothetical protein